MDNSRWFGILRVVLAQTFAALKYPNYRLWFFGQMVSLMGTWMQSTAQAFLIFELTRSPAYLGYVSLAPLLPTWLFMLYGGVIADRIPRRTLLIITQSCMMILAFILALLAFTHIVQPWHIIVLAFFLSIANAFDAPSRQAFVLEMVEREDLTNAIALNGAMFNSATAVGPAIAGLTYAAFGPAWCFTLNGISFIAVIVALFLMKLKPWVAPMRRGSTIRDLIDGFRYVFNQPLILGIILLVISISLFGISFATLIPAWAVEVLHGGAKTNGWLQSARGVGAWLSALFIAMLGRFKFRGKLLTIGTFAFPIMLLIFSTIQIERVALLVLVVVGFSQVLTFNLCNSLVQTIATDEVRGRVMGIYSLSFFGFLPIGGFLVGQAAEWLSTKGVPSSEPITVAIGASITFLSAILVWIFLPALRKEQ